MRFYLRRRTPRQTLVAIAYASALMSAGFLAMTIRALDLAPDQTLPLPWKFCGLTAATVGFLVSILFHRGLRAGVQTHIWPEGALEEARQMAESSVWSVAWWLIAVASLVLFAFSQGHFSGLLGVLPALSPQQARSILRPPVASSRAYGSKSIYPAKPLESAHWGAPPNSPR